MENEKTYPISDSTLADLFEKTDQLQTALRLDESSHRYLINLGVAWAALYTQIQGIAQDIISKESDSDV